MLCLDSDGPLLSDLPDGPVELRDAIAGRTRAYVIFTSGSAGRPKAVEVLVQGVVNFLESMRLEPGFSGILQVGKRRFCKATVA